MGYSHWSDEAFRSVSSGRRSAGAREIFRSGGSIDPLMDPAGLKVREARDSEHHPASVPIIVAFDVTGSMGHIPTQFAQESLGKLMTQLVEHRWVADPQVCFAAVGDAEVDRAPFQVGQFESGLEMDMWLTRIWIESGGGDGPESYLLPHWFAVHHTAVDSWEKREKKGYLFTIGDAENKPLTKAHVKRVFGHGPEGPVSDGDVVAAARERWEVFHVLVKHPSERLVSHWTDLVGDGLLVLENDRAISELIGAVIGVREGTLTRADGEAVLTGAGVAGSAAAKALSRV